MPKVHLRFHAQRTFLFPQIPHQLEFTNEGEELQATLKLENTAHIIWESAELLTKDSPIVVGVPAALHDWGRPSGTWFAVHLIATTPREPAEEPYSVSMEYR
jgi:hypothetical protein